MNSISTSVQRRLISGNLTQFFYKKTIKRYIVIARREELYSKKYCRLIDFLTYPAQTCAQFQVKHLTVKCLAEVHNIETMSQN